MNAFLCCNDRRKTENLQSVDIDDRKPRDIPMIRRQPPFESPRYSVLEYVVLNTPEPRILDLSNPKSLQNEKGTPSQLPEAGEKFVLPTNTYLPPFGDVCPTIDKHLPMDGGVCLETDKHLITPAASHESLVESRSEGIPPGFCSYGSFSSGRASAPPKSPIPQRAPAEPSATTPATSDADKALASDDDIWQAYQQERARVRRESLLLQVANRPHPDMILSSLVDARK